MKAVVTDKWILCPACKSKTRVQILDDTELKHFPLFCPKCKKVLLSMLRIISWIINPSPDAKTQSRNELLFLPVSFFC